MFRRICLLLTAVALAHPAAAQTSHPNTREGFWISFGMGAGSLAFGGDIDSDRESSPSGYLRLGGTPSPSVLVGGEVNGWSKEISGITYSVGFAGAVIVYYPSRTGSFFLKGGLGFVGVDAEDVTGEGFGLSLGLGNEFRLTQNFSLGLFLNAIGSTAVEAQLFGFNTDVKINPNLVQLGILATFH